MGTRWGRFALLLVPSLLAITAFGGALQAGVLAATVEYQSGNATVASSGLYGIDGGIIVGDINRYGRTDRTIRVAVGQVLVNELCLSEVVLGGLATIKVTAGDGDPRTWEISANRAVVDASAMKGSMALDGMVQLGKDASTIDTGTLDLGAKRGSLGIDAGFADVRGLIGTGAAVSLYGAAEVPGISFKMLPGSGAANQCQQPPAPTWNGQRVNPPAAGELSGTVRSAAGQPLGGVRVALVNNEGELNAVRTDASGRFTVHAFVGRAVKVRYELAGYATRWNSGAQAQDAAPPITVTAAPIGGLDVALPACGGPC